MHVNSLQQFLAHDEYLNKNKTLLTMLLFVYGSVNEMTIVGHAL